MLNFKSTTATTYRVGCTMWGRAPSPVRSSIARRICGSKLSLLMWHRRSFSLFLSGILLLPSLSSAQSTTKRLILKDGSYQIVTKFELQGDRVHYYSAERSEWEDIPDSLVDWNATNQYERERAAGKKSPEAIALDKELEEAKQEQEALSPHVAEGLRLPQEGGVYALDTYLGEPQLLPLDQNTGEVNRQRKKNVFRAAINPISGAKQTIELAAPGSKIQIHASLPTIYINLEPMNEEQEPASSAQTTEAGKKSKASKKPTAELPWDRFHIVRVRPKGDHRIVGQVKTAVYGKVTQEQETVATTDEQLGEGWIKITPKAPLEPGEYALAEMLGAQGMNSYVWDFGIHPDAPANLAVIRPEHNQQNPSAVKPELKTDR